MNSVAARLRAVGVTLLAFALGAAALAGVLMGIAQMPALAGLPPGTPPAPSGWIGLLLASRLLGLVTAVFLTIAAAVTLLHSAYLDRMLEIFGDVLLMIIAAATGAAGGTWALLRLLGSPETLSAGQMLPFAAMAALIFVLLLIAPHRMRRTFLTRAVAALVLLLAAPVLLAWIWSL